MVYYNKTSNVSNDTCFKNTAENYSFIIKFTSAGFTNMFVLK